MSQLCKCPNCATIHPVTILSESITNSSETRIGLFIDGGNLYHAAKNLGFKIDFVRLKAHFLQPGTQLFRAFYYAASDSTQPFIMRILDWLRHNGFSVITKQVKKYSNSFMKGNLDVELVIDMLTTIDHYDTAILISGDGDFKRCVEELQRRGKKVIIVSTEKTTPSLLSQELKKQADEFIELSDIVSHIKKE